MRLLLTNGLATQIDAEEYESLSKRSWYIDTNNYVFRTEYVSPTKRRKIYLHRIIMKTPQGSCTDHINGNTLDNRKENLRICTRQQNSANSKKRRATASTYKGVSLDKRDGKWQAKIKQNYIGRFSSEQDAALAYNSAAQVVFGEFAKRNIL